MITASDEGPDFDPDDPLAVILRPTTEYLGPPPGQYEAIRRSATRRRLFRAAAGVGLTCAVAALVALPLHLTASEAPASPTIPLAPPPASSPSSGSSPSFAPTPTTTPEPAGPSPTRSTRTDISSSPTAPAVPTRGTSVTPTASSPGP